MNIGYDGTLPAVLWNPPPPSLQATHHLLIQALDRELARIPIRQQTVIVAVQWDVDGWRVHSFEEAPLSGRYDG